MEHNSNRKIRHWVSSRESNEVSYNLIGLSPALDCDTLILIHC